ncbi:VCBS repeat-containing protein [candidate division KSB1 bacterium]|nr:VCBS repeat-containing protein [candidate division KSB1 bacterium]
MILSLIFFACNSKKSKKETETGKFSFHEVSNLVNLNFLHEPGVDSSYYMPESIGSGCAFLNYDNDGDLDIYMVNGNQHNAKSPTDTFTTNRLFLQNDYGKFSDVTETSGLGDSGYGMGVAVGDINNDGYVDVYITNYGFDALYRNNGDGTFRDGAEALRLAK